MFVLLIAIVCAAGCFLLIQNVFLHWMVSILVIILTMANYFTMQINAENSCWPGASSFVEFYRRASGYRGWIIYQEIAILLAVVVVAVLPYASVHLVGVVSVMVVIPLTTYSSGYLGVRSVSR
ncbi:MAG: hypothetical protein V1668_01165 [Patescibacteria group bacterium]